MTTKKLTAKQEKFCQQYILTGNASEAYRQSYNTQAKPETIQNKAHAMLKKGDIRARVDELREETKKEFTVSAEQKRRMLYELAINCSQVSPESGKPVNPTATVSAIAELNKMDGDLAAIKTELKGSLNVTHEDLLEQLK